MNIHNDAPLTPKGREAMVRDVVDHGLAEAEAALRHPVTAKTVAEWVERFRADGADGLQDRSSRPRLKYVRPSRPCAASDMYWIRSP